MMTTSAQVNETLHTVNEISSFQDYISSSRYSDLKIYNPRRSPVFSRAFREFAGFYFEFSLARKSISFLLISCHDYSLYFGFATLSKSSLTIIMNDM